MAAADLTDIVVGPAGFRVFARRPTSGAEASVFVSFDEVELAGGNPLVAAVHQVNHDLGQTAGRQRPVLTPDKGTFRKPEPAE